MDSPDMRWVIAIALFGAGCAPVTVNAPITEEVFRAAARHCHSKDVIRMHPGQRNVFSVGGLVDSRTGKPSGAVDAERIECVRQYLGIPRKDVWIVFS